MDIVRATLETCGSATGLVVVIDVLRAYTTAAYAFAAGARRIVLVSDVSEALSLRRAHPEVLVMGEDDGRRVPGFDLSNSPSRLEGLDLRGRTLIQRTSAGTQGAVLARSASRLLATGLCTARATAHAIQELGSGMVTLVQTGLRPDGWGDEDVACAEAIEAYLRRLPADLRRLEERVRGSRSGRLFQDPADPDFPPADLECALMVDRFDFAMRIESGPLGLTMQPFRPAVGGA